MRTFPLVVALAAAVLAGCTATPDDATPSPPSTGQSVTPVSNPKDARGVEPRALLTAAQATTLGLDPARAKPGFTADLIDCRWPAAQPPVISVSVTVDTNPTRGGLTDTYLKRSTFPIFEPLVVEGYPAVRAEYGPSDGCTIYVGLSEHQDIRVSAGARSPTDTCALVKRAIAAMLTNLPPQR